MSLDEWDALSEPAKQAFRYAHIGHWLHFFAQFATTELGWSATVVSADYALATLLSAVPQLALPAEIEPHGSPDVDDDIIQPDTAVS